jgi:hypothetical protein
VRAKHDIEGNHSSETPACHRCGLPLLAGSEYCPFCERALVEGTVARLLGHRGLLHPAPGERAVLGVPQRVLFAVGALTCLGIAVACIVLAILS